MVDLTPPQTIGPYFKSALSPDGEYPWPDAFSNNLVTPDVNGGRIRVEGKVFDGDGDVVLNSMLEIWQADGQGRFSDPRDERALPNATFRGFGRCDTGNEGKFSFLTVKPGRVPGPNGKPQAPHILLAVHARGMSRQEQTRIYFSDETAANAADQILALVPAHRRETLIARRDDTAQGAVYRFDIHLQGHLETVFFDL